MNAQHPLGKLARLPLQFIPKDAVLPILTRSHWGLRWIAGSGPHGCWLGIAEREKRKRVTKTLAECRVFYDLGANVGYYSLLAAKGMKAGGKVFAFEPSQRNLEFLRKHLSLNHIENVEIISAAVSDRPGEMTFDDSGDPVAYRISETGQNKVAVITLDEFVFDKKNPAPDVIKIDTEGEEYKILIGAKKVIESARPIIFIETHNRFVPEVHESCLKFLESFGYQFEEYDGNPPTEILATPASKKL